MQCATPAATHDQCIIAIAYMTGLRQQGNESDALLKSIVATPSTTSPLGIHSYALPDAADWHRRISARVIANGQVRRG
jgi:hypothetical protein